jgi:hypothetical protein
MCKTQKEKNSHSLTPNKTWHTSLTVEKATKLVTPKKRKENPSSPICKNTNYLSSAIEEPSNTA